MGIFRSQRRAAGYLRCVQSHVDRILAAGTAVGYGPDPCAMWMSSLDLRTGRYPADDSHPPGIGKRVYRAIDAPRGCTLYWDQPLLAAAYALSERTGRGEPAEAADAYVRAFLDRCVAGSGLFLWGNHYYYDAFRGRVIRFAGSEEPVACDPRADDGSLHELRPIRPAWDVLWRLAPEATERHIRRMAERHVFDPATGGFNRHADGQRGHAFLEAGGILVEAVAFLADRTGEAHLLDLAVRAAGFHWRHRDKRTGLVPNDPTADRWDRHVCTTEVGLWARCLLRAAELLGEEDLSAMAYGAVSAYLARGYDEQEGLYFGRLRVSDGLPDRSRKSTLYQPGVHSDPWQALFPTHDYALPMAAACLDLYRLTGAREFDTAVRRWAEILAATAPRAADDLQTRYAESFGRGVRFLLDAADTLHDGDLRRQAIELADRAVEMLFARGMFRGHTGEDRCDAVDGVGYLLLALLDLERRRPGKAGGYHF
jgi:hypothetical protein